MGSMNRRSFITGAAATGLAAGAVGMGSSVMAEEAPGWLPAAWDHECDVLVLGLGCAGTNAAIAAHDAGAETVVIEVAPAEFAGGNASVCGGGLVTPYDKETYVDFLYDCSFGTTPRKYLEDHATALEGILDWLDDIGLTYIMDGEDYGKWKMSGDAPEVVSSLAGHTKTGINHYGLEDEDGNVASGPAMMRQFIDLVEEREIPVFYEHRATKLYQDPVTKTILGAMATDKDGNEVTFKARKGVIIATGGFENNPEMIDAYIRPGARVYPCGTPYNRGDGQIMAQEVGAKMWHMDGIEWMDYGIRPFAYVDSDVDMAADCVAHSSWKKEFKQIMISPYGYRFRPETVSYNHTRQFDGLDFVGYYGMGDQLADYKARWCYLLFDQSRYDDLADQGGAGEIYVESFIGPTGTVCYMGWLAGKKMFHWDVDQALETGLLVKADTIEELCEKLGIVYVDNVKKTLADYNQYCADGSDPEFNRDPETMFPIDNPPYYAVTLYPSFVNTQGGPVHTNLDTRVEDNHGGYIPRLFATGECGSVYTLLYHGSGNIAEAIVSGANAGRAAAALDNWE